MKRRHATAAFAVVSFTWVALSISQWLELQHNQSVNAAVQAVPAALNADQFADTQTDDGQNLPLEVRFTRATALLNGGGLELAEKHLSIMANDEQHPDIALAAQFNLANGYLREALDTSESSGQYRSLIELAKQRYRDLLFTKPEHWDARYNLELALRLSPEVEAYEVDDKGKPIKSVSVVFPGFEDRELP